MRDLPPTGAGVEPPPPAPATLAQLRSLDRRTFEDAWQRAWPALYSRGKRLADRLIFGAAHEPLREEVVTRAIQQLQADLITTELAQRLLAERAWLAESRTLAPATLRDRLETLLGRHLTTLLASDRRWSKWSGQLDAATLVAWLEEKADPARSCNRMQTFGDLLHMTLTAVRMRACDALKRLRATLEDSVEHLPEPALEDGPGPGALPRIPLAAILDQVRKIAPPFPTFFTDHYLDGLSIQEIADRSGVPKGTVGANLWRGTLRLRKLLHALPP